MLPAWDDTRSFLPPLRSISATADTTPFLATQYWSWGFVTVGYPDKGVWDEPPGIGTVAKRRRGTEFLGFPCATEGSEASECETSMASMFGSVIMLLNEQFVLESLDASGYMM